MPRYLHVIAAAVTLAQGMAAIEGTPPVLRIRDRAPESPKLRSCGIPPDRSREDWRPKNHARRHR